MKVYVGTYGKYNNGNLQGAWFNLEDYSCKDEFLDTAIKFHNDESDPELMYQDWDDDGLGLIGESVLDEKLWDLFELNDDEQSTVKAYASNGIELEEALENAMDCFAGIYDTEAEFAEEWTIDVCGVEVPNHVVVDWEATWRCNLRHDIFSVRFNGDLYFFHNH
tara:strand:+ start:155 stop:646 length:492 start_codon:yes stop_codon:yes gene_type:complete